MSADELNEIDRKSRQEAKQFIWDKYVRTGMMREADVRAVFDAVFAEVDHYIAKTIALHRAGAISDEELKKIINTVKGFLKEMGSPVE